MAIERFEDIGAWQKTKELIIYSYKTFEGLRDYSFKDQFLRAAVSIMNNIAEGYERLGDKEFRHFLYISKGSCGEVRSMCYLALELKYITKEQFNTIIDDATEISRMLSGFIKKLN